MDMSVEGGTASMAGVAAKAMVCRNTAKKYCDMYDEDPAALSLYISSRGKPGPSANSSPVIDEVGMAVLIFTYSQDPSTSLLFYKQRLSAAGIYVSESTISKALLSSGMRRGMPDLHPIDKWSDDNLIRLADNLSFIKTIDPSRLCLCDEFHLDGNNVWRRKVRMNPFT
jgi:hypothetical protein